MLPSLVILIALSWIYLAYGHVPAVAGVLYGVKPAVVAIVLLAALAHRQARAEAPLLWAIAAAAFVAISRCSRCPFRRSSSPPAPPGARRPAGAPPPRARVPDTCTGAQNHAAAASTTTRRPRRTRATRRAASVVVVAVLVALWWRAYGALLAPCLADGTLARDGAASSPRPRCSPSAAPTRCCPTSTRARSRHYGWLTAAQMIDGLALGETTPGPLIMVVAFVGFVGGWTHALFGPDALVAAGIAGAVVATWFTFLPSFLFILAGGPLRRVDARRNSGSPRR